MCPTVSHLEPSKSPRRRIEPKRDAEKGPAHGQSAERPFVGYTVRKRRNEHGTRVARRIVCKACGGNDTLAFAPRDAADTLCRKCAFETLGVRDAEDSTLQQDLVPCRECGYAVKSQYPDPLCRNCKNGIEVSRTDRARRGERVSDKVVRVRRKTAR